MLISKGREVGPNLEPGTAGYDGPGCSKCAADFARTDSNVFICMKCVAWLLLKGLSWHRYAASNICKTYFFQTSGTHLCACLNMKSQVLAEGKCRKTFHLAFAALNVRT